MGLSNERLVDWVPTLLTFDPSTGDLLYVVYNPGGVPISRKLTIGDLFENMAYPINIYNLGRKGSASYERSFMKWEGNILKIGTEAAGTGVVRGIQLGNTLFTPEGGIAVRLTNKTGAPSVKGTIVSTSATTDNAFKIENDEYDGIGAVYEAGIADGSLCFVVVSGICEVLLKDTTASTRGNWVYADPTDGRANATLAAPPGGGIPEHDAHFKEIGHCLESKLAGVNVLAKIIMHFN